MKWPIKIKAVYFIVLVLVVASTIIYFQFKQYLSIETVMAHHDALLTWTALHPIKAVLLYSLIFASSIACGIPTASFLTLLGGTLFGPIAILYAEISTALGGFILFLITKHTLGDYFAGLHQVWIKKFEAGFKKNAFNYLLMLRLMPILPCWVSNISAGVFNISNKTFLIATLIGIFPATCIYGLAGNSLEIIIHKYGEITLTEIMLTPIIFIPLLALAILSIAPILYKSISRSR